MDGKCDKPSLTTHHPPRARLDHGQNGPRNHTLVMAKLVRDEHHLVLYADGAQQNHHTGVGIARYHCGIEVIREAAGFNDNAEAYDAEL